MKEGLLSSARGPSSSWARARVLRAAGASQLLLTDHNDIVLKLAASNGDRIASATGASVATAVLEWGSADDRATVRAAAPSPSSGWPLVIGADVAYSVAALPGLCGTVSALVATNGVALIGYVSRSGLLDRGLPLAAREAGLTAAEVPGTRRCVGGGLEGWIVRMEKN
jgi:threonine dehydrogenase-like Zn-dependent dehydrogenase